MPRPIHKLFRGLLHCYPFPRGDGRLVDRTFLGRLRFDDETLLVRTTDGFEMRVWPNDHIGRLLYLTGKFDRTVVEILRDVARPDDHFLDIGANVGYVSCALLTLLPGCNVTAIEPHPGCFELLTENLNRVDADRSRALLAAISDQPGEGFLELDGDNSGKSHLVPDVSGKTDTARVRQMTGDELLGDDAIEKVNLIKIDVEGHERRVLASLHPIIEAHRPRAVVFEHTGAEAGPRGDIYRLFDDLGYRVFGVQKHLTRYRLIDVNASEATFHEYVATCEND